jgi:cytochrome c-type biogenesis protein CcmH/NrfG
MRSRSFNFIELYFGYGGIMKKIFFLIVIVMISAAGCKQQNRQPQGQTVLPGGPMMPSPEEIRHLQQLAEQTPKNSEAWAMLGNALMDSHRFPEAIDAYRKSLALDPKNTNIRVDMGTCYRNSKQPQRAIEEYAKALELDPNHINANRNMGVVLAFDLNDKKGAIKAFEKYLSLAPSAPDAQDIRQTTQRLKSGN